MKYQIVFLFTLFLMVRIALADDPVSFSTQWIPDKPQMMTYSSKDKYGDQLYQVSIYKKDDNFEIYINIISNGFTKSVTGTFNSAMYPLQSSAKIIVNGQIVMDTKCSYAGNNLIISTLMSPYNTTMAQNFEIDQRIIDFSQVPIIVRTLTLENDSEYTCTFIYKGEWRR